MGNAAVHHAPARPAPGPAKSFLFASAAPAGRILPTRGEIQESGVDRLERASRLGHDFARVPVHIQDSQPNAVRPSLPLKSGNAPIQLVKFNAEQRAKILAKNRRRNGGFYTCENGACGFQHALTQYATHRGRRIGDGGFHIDHIHHHGRGGRALIRNGRVLCGTCNTSRGSRANAQRYGINKYRGLHRKRALKNYSSIRRNY